MNSGFDITPYKHLIHFIGACLGSQSEVILYCFDDIEHSVIDICHPGISGIATGDPLTGFAVSVMKDKGKEGPPYYLNHVTTSKQGVPLRSHSFLILDKKGNPAAMIAVHTDVREYQKAASILEKMAHLPHLHTESPVKTETVSMQLSPLEMIRETIAEVTDSLDVPPERLTKNEKIEIVRRLNQEGFFLIKGAVKQVAVLIGSSEATIYRYLSEISKS